MSVAAECMKDDRSREYIIKHVGDILKNEIKTLCSDSFSSTLLQSNSSHLKNFDYNDIIEEAKECIPLLHRLLTQCLKTLTARTNTNAITI